MTYPAGSKWKHRDTYAHPDGTVFTRSTWGTWFGSDGSNVDDSYIDFLVMQEHA